MDNKSATFDLATALTSIQRFVNKVETGEGLDLTDEQKIKFKAELKKQNFDSIKSDFDSAINDIRNKTKKMSNATN